MKTLFHINPTETDNRGGTLLCEWGEAHCCYAVYDENGKSVNELRYLTFDQPVSSINIDEFLEAVGGSNPLYNRVVISSAFPQAMLVPRKHFAENGPHLAMLNGGKSMDYFHDLIGEWQVVNSYAFPRSVYQRSSERLGTPDLIHYYTTALKSFNGFTAENQLSVDITPANFRVIVKKGSQLQLAQMYAYTTPLDVVYYLLKIFQELALPKEDTYIVLSGLVEENSALYKELRNYFLNMHFARPLGVSLQNEAYPQHFFTSLINLAACVS